MQTQARTPAREADATWWRAAVFVAVALSLATWVGIARAHEPIFGIGPHTIHQYGIGLEVGRESGDNGSETQLEAIYGVTEDLSVTVSVPRHQDEEGGSGWGSLLARSKWRFYRKDSPGGSNQAAVVFGARFPAFEDGATSLGYLLGVTAGREARFEYLFGGLRTMLNTEDGDGFRPGNVFKYDLAVGMRPFPGDYEDPDLVVLLELNGTYLGSPTLPGAAASFSTGHVEVGNRLGVGPGLILTYKNIMVKAGINVVVMDGSKGIPFGEEVESVFAIESHLSPFSFIYGM